MDILQKINADKILEVRAAQTRIPLAEIRARAADAEPARDFLAAVRTRCANRQNALIAEIKKASPSKGLIREDFHPADLARAYADGGAACLSVLTDEKYFQGSLNYLAQAKNAVSLPVLRKDFVVDFYQIHQARAAGADAVLLIAASLEKNQLAEFEHAAHEYGMTALIELHEEREWEKCADLASPLFGVNNRNLRTFAVDTAQTVRLLPLLAGKTVVCESGIGSRDDIAAMNRHGVYAFLVGESLMRQTDVARATRALLDC